jgi:uncharacterized cupredoxin-like copper-binding protein
VRRFRFGLVVLVLIAAGVATTALAARYDAARARSVTTVKASEVEWGIKTSKKTSHAGKISFAVRNAGKLTHQFIVLRTNLPANKLPSHGTTVNLKKAGKVLGKISLAPGQERAHLADAESRALRSALQPARALPIGSTRRFPGEVSRLRRILKTPETGVEGAGNLRELSCSGCHRALS